MRAWGLRRPGVPGDVLAAAGLDRGERVLASALADDGTWLLGTPSSLVVVGADGDGVGAPTRVPWERVEGAHWDRDEERLHVVCVAEYGQVRPELAFGLAQAPDRALLIDLVRERVTASIVLSRRTAVQGRRGFLVVARRSPGRDGPLDWLVDYDDGVDPQDPVVALAVDEAVAAAQRDVGL